MVQVSDLNPAGHHERFRHLDFHLVRLLLGFGIGDDVCVGLPEGALVTAAFYQ